MPVGMKVIRPKRRPLFDVRAVTRAVEEQLDETAQAVRSDFLATVATWSGKGGKPRFGVKKTRFNRVIYTESQKYAYVNDGTRPHVIAPKSKAVLVFKASYQAKTAVRTIASQAGGGSGATVFTRKEIHHPGTEGRHFDEAIREKWEGRLPRDMQAAIDAEVR